METENYTLGRAYVDIRAQASAFNQGHQRIARNIQNSQFDFAGYFARAGNLKGAQVKGVTRDAMNILEFVLDFGPEEAYQRMVRGDVEGLELTVLM